METQIVVLDGNLVNPGDLSWAALNCLGKCTIYDNTSPEQILERVQDAQMVLTNKVVFNRALLRQLRHVQYIGILATGYNIIDVEAANEWGITVTNVPDYCTHTVAQSAFALLLELTNHVSLHDASVHVGEWSRSKDFCYWKRPVIELRGLKMGIIGYGKIGSLMAKLAQAFEMQVLVHTPKGGVNQPNLCFVGLKELLQQSDVVSLHCPLTSETSGLLDTTCLAWMKNSALLVNTSRGALIVESDLAQALNTGQLAGAALDVLSQEPPSADNPLLSAKNCLITPHLSWTSRVARERLLQTAVANAQAFLAGTLQNVVTQHDYLFTGRMGASHQDKTTSTA